MKVCNKDLKEGGSITFHSQPTQILSKSSRNFCSEEKQKVETMNPQIFDFISSSLLLDPSIRGDLPMPLYKTASQILEENLFSLIIFLIVLLFIVIIWLYLRKRNSGTTDKERTGYLRPFSRCCRCHPWIKESN